MDDLVNREVLSKLKALVAKHGKPEEFEQLPYICVRSVKVESDHFVFEFQSRENTNTESIFVILLNDEQYVAFTNTMGDFLSSKDIELYNKEMNCIVDVVDPILPDGEKGDFLSAARSLFKVRDGSLTKKAL